MIKYIDIKNYKGFENLKIENFKKVNLITGANDIGKTSLLEALSFSTFSNPDSIVINLLQLINKRDPEIALRQDIISYIKKYYNFFEFSSNLSEIKFESPESIEYLFKIKTKEETKVYKEIVESDLIQKRDNKNMVFIVDHGGSVMILKRWYEIVQKREDEEFINDKIAQFDTNIESFKIIGEEPSVKIKESKEYIPISELGDGLKRFIFMLIAFYKVGQNGYIFIDEIENGIWYKNYTLLWKNIFYLSDLFDIQLFITTHSKEMIDSFLKVSKEEKFDAISLIELVQKEGFVKYIQFDQTTLSIELENDFEVRG
ncbi:hypothetical protein MNB_SM-7-348 [hydrothermal vent metagenome]|uniref:Endonuclease GajA/Old nuclease/RecF-like AAA domain-containing protein n=1 Tax=hydrothermal vent metagenome TaxID=652676 RepID=A0A1W1BRG2_9ZZZZ